MAKKVKLNELRERFIGRPAKKAAHKLPDLLPEPEAIAALLVQGYSVEVIDPYADRFDYKYRVWQNPRGSESKVVAVNRFGEVTRLQG